MNSFEEIYSEYYSRMFRVAQKMLVDKESAADIVQDVFVCLFDKLGHGSVILYPHSWLYRATTNKCIDFLRRKKKFRSIEEVKESRIDEGKAEEPEVIDAISKAISKLKPTERVIAILYSENLSYKEIAQASGVKFSSIGKTLSRALKKLEKELKNQHYELY